MAIQFLLLSIWMISPVVGIVAAKVKGFNPVWGALGGVILGPLAILLFFVDSLVIPKK